MTTNIEQTIKNVKKWELRRGKKEYLQHLERGKPLTYKQAVIAKCYECNCGFPDGTVDCKIIACPLYGFMPFREGGPQKMPGRKILSSNLTTRHYSAA